MIRDVSDIHEHAPDAFDHLLEGVQAELVAPNPCLEVTLDVPVSSAMLTSLVDRAAREGRDIAEVVADALRSAAA